MINPIPPRPTIPFAMAFRESPGDLTCVLCNRDGADYEGENRALPGKRVWWGAHRSCLESHEHRTAPKVAHARTDI